MARATASPSSSPRPGRCWACSPGPAGARTVVEVGTAIGVSTLHLARAVGPGGRVISFEIDAERQAAARDYLTRAGVIDRTDLRLQDAAAGLRELDGPVDMAFLDGLKADYPEHLELILRRVTARRSRRGRQRALDRHGRHRRGRRRLERRAHRAHARVQPPAGDRPAPGRHGAAGRRRRRGRRSSAPPTRVDEGREGRRRFGRGRTTRPGYARVSWARHAPDLALL